MTLIMISKCRKRGKNMKLLSKMENYYTNKTEDLWQPSKELNGSLYLAHQEPCMLVRRKKVCFNILVFWLVQQPRQQGEWWFMMESSRYVYNAFQPKNVLLVSRRCVLIRTSHDLWQAIWPYSGHYHPTEENFKEFMGFLEEHQVDLTDVKVKLRRTYNMYFYYHVVVLNYIFLIALLLLYM